MSFYAHLFTEKKCEADFWKASHQLEGETFTGTYGMVIFDHF